VFGFTLSLRRFEESARGVRESRANVVQFPEQARVPSRESISALYQGSQRAALGAFLEFSLFQGCRENSRVEPAVILYDRW
jgi:hypothetical protein